jgi:hypothetical protein
MGKTVPQNVPYFSHAVKLLMLLFVGFTRFFRCMDDFALCLGSNPSEATFLLLRKRSASHTNRVT